MVGIRRGNGGGCRIIGNGGITTAGDPSNSPAGVGVSNDGGIVTCVAELDVVGGGTFCEIAMSGGASNSLARVDVTNVGGVVTCKVELVGGGGGGTFCKIVMLGGGF